MNVTARRTGIALTALLLAAALGLPARAAVPAPTVGPAELFSTHAFGEDLVIDREGDATVVWTRSVARPVVLAASRAHGADWGSWTTLGRGFSPQVGVDAKGVVTAVWRTPKGGLDSARLRADGTWATPTHLVGPGGHVLGFDLDVGPGGTAVVAWTHRTGAPGSPRQISWVQRVRGGSWSTPRAVTRPGHVNEPYVGLSNGLVTLVYGVQRPGHPQAVLTRSKAVGRSWTGPRVLTRSGYDLALVTDRAGGAMVVFEPGARSILKSVTRPAGGRWGMPTRLSPAGVQVHRYSMAMNGAGAAVLAWVRGHGGSDAMTRGAGQGWSAPTRLSDPGTRSAMVAVSINGAGDSLATWGYFGLQVAAHLAGAPWSGAAVVEPAGDQVLEVTRPATGPGGDSLLLYKHEETALRVRDVIP